MSERFTAIKLRGFSGIADRGRLTRSEMIRQYRDNALSQKKECEIILSAKDSDFIVETFIGLYVMKNKQVVDK